MEQVMTYVLRTVQETRQNTVDKIQVARLFSGHYTAIYLLYYQKTDTIVVISLHPTDGSYARSHYDAIFQVYKLRSNSTRFVFLFEYCEYLSGLLQRVDVVPEEPLDKTRSRLPGKR